MEAAAHVAASGLDSYKYLTATDPADLMVMGAVADRSRELRQADLAEVLGQVL